MPGRYGVAGLLRLKGDSERDHMPTGGGAGRQRVAVNSVCPGWTRTEMGGDTAPRSVKEGAVGVVWLAADAPQEKTGLFWRDRKVIAW